MQKHSLWLLPSAADHQRLQKVTASLSKQFQSPAFLPHLTLLSPIYGNPETLSDRLVSLAQRNTTLSLNPSTFVFKPTFYQSCTLALQASPALITLRTEAMAEFQTRDDRPFEPHISLAYVEPEVVSPHELARHLSDELLAAPVQFSKLGLLSTDGSVDQWRVIAREKFSA